MDNVNRMILRNLLFIWLICLAILLVGCARLDMKQPSSEPIEPEDPPYSWDGELNPDELKDWPVISTLPDPYQGVVWLIIGNPDPGSPINKVAMMIDFEGTLWGYRYFKHGEPHSFWFNAEQNKYVEQTLTEEMRDSCKLCHPDQDNPDKYRGT